jgi:hypothetical protein
MAEKLRWFYEQVRNKGPWDFKRRSPWFEDFGNVHYGVVGSALGLPAELLLRGAGRAQQEAGTSRPKWGNWYDTSGKITVTRNEGGETIVTRTSFGDDPKDQNLIKLGIAFYDKIHPMFETVDPNPLYGKTDLPIWLFETLHGALDKIVPSQSSLGKIMFQTYFPGEPVFENGELKIPWTTTSPVESLKGLIDTPSSMQQNDRVGSVDWGDTDADWDWSDYWLDDPNFDDPDDMDDGSIFFP